MTWSRSTTSATTPGVSPRSTAAASCREMVAAPGSGIVAPRAVARGEGRIASIASAMPARWWRIRVGDSRPVMSAIGFLQRRADDADATSQKIGPPMRRALPDEDGRQVDLLQRTPDLDEEGLRVHACRPESVLQFDSNRVAV